MGPINTHFRRLTPIVPHQTLARSKKGKNRQRERRMKRKIEKGKNLKRRKQEPARVR